METEIDQIYSKPKKCIACVFFIISLIAPLAKCILCVVICAKIIPWYFYGKIVALMYPICSLITAFFSILDILSLFYNYLSKCDCYCIECCIDAFVESCCRICCCCNENCLLEGSFWINWLLGCATIIIGINKDSPPDNEFITLSDPCSRSYYDMQMGMINYLESHPNKYDKYMKWAEKFNYKSVCTNILVPLIIIQIIHFLSHIILSCIMGCCQCCQCCKCCSRKPVVNNNQENNENQNSKEQNSDDQYSINIGPNQNNDAKNSDQSIASPVKQNKK